MKIILIALVFISLNGFSQKLDSVNSVTWKYMPIYISSDSTLQYIAIYNTDKLEIIGDTITLIKKALIETEKMSNKYWKAKDVLDYLNLDILSRMINKKYFYEAVKEYKKSQKQSTK